jgi:hypothetical protein
MAKARGSQRERICFGGDSMTCPELNFPRLLNGRVINSPQEQEAQWASRRARAYRAKDKAAKDIIYFSDDPEGTCANRLEDAIRDLALHSADIVKIDYEGRERGWLKDTDESTP